MNSKTWQVTLTINEDGDDTYVDAVLQLDNKMELRGRGMSRRNPRDESEPRIGDELAAARALSHLAHELLGMAAADIESKTHLPPRSLAI